MGVKQGNIKSSEHYKLYNKPLLDSVDESNLGIQIGSSNYSLSCCADDFLGMSDDPKKLQGILDIAAHYGQMYQIRYGSDKTKVVVYGSKIDQQYYLDVKPWHMNGENVNVVNENEHLGQIISNENEYQKNIDMNITKARKSLFSLIGPTLSSKCKLNPRLKLHILRTYVTPVLKNGLSTFPIRPSFIESLDIFHKKNIKNALSLSVSAPSSAVYFLAAELPLTAQLHYDIFLLFYIIWSNPQTKIFKMVRYLLEFSC